MNPHPATQEQRAFTLLELLLTLAIIGLLLSLLLPALERGQVRVRSLQCKSNLHQLGLGMLSFAQAHEDKFPVQISTNQGGSSEFIDAGNSVNGEFYFAYKHFLPLAAEIGTPKLLACPADKRSAAMNFISLRNTNLSYFVGASPQFGHSESILSGDRNLTPLTNSIARIRGAQTLRWTGEMHEYKGNVLFADGHVEQQNNTLSQPGEVARGTTGYTSLVIPSLPRPVASGPVAGAASGRGGGSAGASGGGAVQGGNLKASFGSGTNVSVATNASGPLTNLTIVAGPPKLPPWPFTTPGPGGVAQPPPMPSVHTQQSAAAALAVGASSAKTDNEHPQPGEQAAADPGNDPARKATRMAYFLPWWLVVGLLLGCLWLLYRTQHRRGSSVIETRPEPFHPRPR